jgi:hypothetical protein
MQLSFSIMGKKINEIRSLKGKDIIGIVADDSSGLVIGIKQGKLELRPVKEFTQNEIIFS